MIYFLLEHLLGPGFLFPTYNDFVITDDGIEAMSNSNHSRASKLLAEGFLNDGISSEGDRADFMTLLFHDFVVFQNCTAYWGFQFQFSV